jgi:UDP-N-acetylglucosamine--N-acetylmuramyl-(pentapeptide) pyrophosphoryl-undecaprenol N-acetylglucosamine transferase
VYPGLAVVQALDAVEFSSQDERKPLEILYVGGEDGVEAALAGRAGLPFVGIPAAGVHGVALVQAIRNLYKLMRGCLAAYRLGRRAKPSVLFVTGGYVSVPVALACWVLRTPIMVYLPDIEPGLAVRFLARLAARVGVTVDQSCEYFSERKTVVTGYPVRPEFRSVERSQALKSLGLQPSDPVLLVLGGSRGARSINRAVAQVLSDMLELTQIIHISGQLDWSWVAKLGETLPPGLVERYHAFPYLHEEMGPAMAAADLVVCRSGASSLGELPYFGLPAVLVPYPHAWRYQRTNAEWLVARGAARLIDDDCLSSDLLPMVRQLVQDNDVLAEMSEAASSLAKPDAAACLAGELLLLAQGDDERGLRAR